jgi:hypothetical protein
MKLFLKFGLPALLVALSLSCNEGTNTLFEDIINDTPIQNNNQLGNTANVPSMTKIGSTYYAATGVIRYRADSDTTWYTLSLATGYHNTVATDGTNLYAGVVYDNGTGDLYQYVPGSGTITKVIIAADLKYIFRVKNFDNAVYASYEKTDGSYAVCKVTGTTGSELGGFVSLNTKSPLSDFVDPNPTTGSYIFFVTETNVYRWDNPSTITDVTPSSSYT